MEEMASEKASEVEEEIVVQLPELESAMEKTGKAVQRRATCVEVKWVRSFQERFERRKEQG
jgi:hypothetical protein